MKKIILAVLIVAILIFGTIILLQKRGLNLQGERPAGNLPDVAGAPFAGTTQPTTPAPSLQEKDSETNKTTFGVLRDVTPQSYAVRKEGILIATPDGKILRLANGKEEEISKLEKESIIAATFSSDGNWVLVRYGNPSASSIAALNIESKKWTPIPMQSISASFSPDNTTAAIFGEQQGRMGLWMVDFSAPKPTPILAANLNALDVEIGWVDKNTVLLWSKGSNESNGNIWSYEKKKGLTLLQSDVPGLSAKAMGNGFFAAFSNKRLGQRGGVMEVYDAAGQKITNLDLITLPEKCSPWQPLIEMNASDTAGIICAIPREQQTLQNKFLPESYQNGQFQGSDDFFVISFPSLNSKTVYVNEYSPVNVWNMSSNEKTLLMSDVYSGKMFGLIIP